MKNKIDYIVIAGSSGGHILPALKFINELSKIRSPKNILFITDHIGEHFIGNISNTEIDIMKINSKNKFLFICNIVFSLSFKFFANRKINLIGFGGFITTPILYLSKIFNVLFLSSNKIFIHEQNIVLGLANKINYIIANKVFISFPKNLLSQKEIYVGNFFKNNFDTLIKDNNNLIKILLLGGSAGSVELNNLLINKLTKLKKEDLKNISLDVQVPFSFMEKFKPMYLDILKNVSFFSFKNNLQYSDYDLIISRSGSGSLNEILYSTNSVYFVPHIHSRDGHQKLNLDYFKKYGQSLNNLNIPRNKQKRNNLYFNNLINPFSINKMICYLNR